MAISTYISKVTKKVKHKVTVTKKKRGKVIARKYQQFESLEEAKAWESCMRTYLDASGFLGNHVTAFSTVSEAARVLQQHADWGFLTLCKTESSNLRVLSDPAWGLGDVALCDLDNEHIETFCKLRRGVSTENPLVEPQTTWSNLTTLSLLLKTARTRYKASVSELVSNDADLLAHLRRENLIRKPKSRQRRLSANELQRIFDGLLEKEKHKRVRIPYTLMFLLSLTTAMRIAELVNIRVEDIDFEKKVIRLRQFKGFSGNRSDTQYQPLIRNSFELLKLYVAKKGITEGRIFDFTAGGVSKGFREVVRELDIEDLRYHDLRREAISQLLDMQLSLKEVMSVSRHKDAKVFEEHYSQPDIANMDDRLNGNDVPMSYEVLNGIKKQFQKNALTTSSVTA
ncbi:phage integrase family protein [Alteromonas sp. I10]|uniref:site-specific integrase n=1 Tax=Alteromonas TaxID=226 RepID=UPI000D753CE2|nr:MULTISPECIES: site-specific integrase [Alteromonas]PXW69710.1 phage integrase family protein [Alteromonas sp. I10]